MNKLIELFQEEPRKWSFRGDPFLWNDLKVHFVNNDIPKTKSELESLFKLTFKDFVNEEIDSGKQIYIKKYTEGEMDSGMIDYNFWYEKAIPILINTYSKILEIKKHETIRVQHRFINHQIDLNTETLKLGTFNPEASNNDADFLYGRSRNYLGRLLPSSLSKPDLKGAPKKEKLEFIKEHKNTNPRYWNLIKEVEKLTGHGVVINTSMNVRGEPIVCNILEAYRCFMSTEMGYLVINNYLYCITDQPNWKNREKWLVNLQTD